MCEKAIRLRENISRKGALIGFFKKVRPVVVRRVGSFIINTDDNNTRQHRTAAHRVTVNTDSGDDSGDDSGGDGDGKPSHRLAALLQYCTTLIYTPHIIGLISLVGRLPR